MSTPSTNNKVAEDQALVFKTERCVESVMKKTTIGAVAPLGLLLFTSRLKVVGSFMLLGAGIGMGMGINQCKHQKIENFKVACEHATAKVDATMEKAKATQAKKIEQLKALGESAKENAKEKVENVKEKVDNTKEKVEAVTTKVANATKDKIDSVTKADTPSSQ
ncbi:hypothetical protein PPL_07738 [Heterostelium album PN500]|uniref:Uncharacterized protein n=1 Tax=Heterostelium pallidum (strain ATCC 26659 / Pp 5 / PN500) TaxID=670386 RepID=D3BGT6_HETP5|nr:hypothetical protein PPL_07738 [Heterostelium album PN500]EFA79320.1 hypothetical protein PPL_07738 [Heterostelium album PN500]|eukprot:XP_020431441.1 hypothetical protein PPL_07738 [Heterostelium album PN500]